MISPKVSTMSANIYTVSANTKTPSVPADFETAITATGFGKYNFLFLLLILASGWAATLESSTMAYVFPAAQCDLDLSLEDKGLLNAITYSGMISSAIIWGFLFDTLGRRKLLMIGFSLDFVAVVASSLSQTKEVLIASKFFGGFIMNGPYAALSTYVSEFHSNTYRGKMQLMIAINELVDEVSLNKKDTNEHGGQITAKRTQLQALREGWQQIKPLFFPPYLGNVILVCLIQTLFTSTVNTMRLWLPQIFQALNDYEYYHNVSSVDLCESLEMIKTSNITSDECQVVCFDKITSISPVPKSARVL